MLGLLLKHFLHLKNNFINMLLNELKKSKWYKKSKKRLGRWNASWKGNYSTKWLKWQKARSGGVKAIWFEWWQTPLTRRIPKLKGFKRYYKLVTNYQIVNVWNLNQFRAWTTIDKSKLFDAGLIKKVNSPVKILWNWNLEKKLKFKNIDSFSNSAKSKIEAIWWEIID